MGNNKKAAILCKIITEVMDIHNIYRELRIKFTISCEGQVIPNLLL